MLRDMEIYDVERSMYNGNQIQVPGISHLNETYKKSTKLQTMQSPHVQPNQSQTPITASQ
jgi:hypothetical protein